MKLLRPLLLSLGALAVLLAMVVGVALLPAVQRWAAFRTAAGQPGLTLRRLDWVSAGAGHLSLRGVEFTRRGVAVKVDSVEADYSLFGYLFGSRLVVDRLTVRGLDLDASRLSRRQAEVGAAAAPAAAPSALAHVAVPYDLFVGTVDLQGKARLPGAPGREAVQAEYTLTGGDLSPGREGTLHFQARLVDPSVSARVGVLQARVDLLVRQALNRAFDRVGLNALIEASGTALNGQDQLRLAAELMRATNGENYRVRLDTVRAGTATNLLSLNALLPTAGAAYRGDWSLTARTEQIEPFSLGGPLPRFDLRGSGAFVLNPGERSGSLQGSLQGQVGELGALLPALRAIGTVRLDGRFDCALDKQVVKLAGLDLSVAGETPVAEIHLSRPAAFSLRERRFQLGADSGGELLRLKLTALPLAWIRPFVSTVDLSGGAISGALVLTGAGEQRLQFRTDGPLRLSGANVARSGRLLLAGADATAELSGEVSAAAFTVTLGSLTLQTAAGDKLQAQGVVSGPLGPVSTTAVSLSLQADLPKLLSPWVPGLHLRAKADADATLGAAGLELRRFDLQATDGHERPLLTLALSRSFTLELQKFTVDTGAGESELARLGFGPISLAPLPLGRTGFAVSGQAEPADYRLLSRGGQLVLRAQAPARVTGLALKRSGRPVVEQLNLEFSPVVELSGRNLARLASGDVHLREGSGAELGQFSAELTQTPDGLKQGTLTFAANLAALATQPALGSLQSLQAGRASGEVRTAAGGGALRVEARATLNGLVLREGNQALPVANLTLRTDLQKDGHFSLQAPVLLDRSGERTDLNLTVEGNRAPQAIVFDARLASEHADLGDIRSLLAVLGTPLLPDEQNDEARSARALAPPAADERAFWTGLQGEIALDVKKVTGGKDWTSSGLTGRLVVEPSRVQLQKLEADFGEKSRLAAKGEITFAAGQNPYALQGNFSLTEFDLGPLLKTLEPGRPPTVEGLFTVAGQTEGRGLTLADTLDRVQGQYQLTSRQGVFRGLKRISDKLSVASKAVELGAALGSILGTDRVKRAAEKVAGHAYLIDQLAQTLGEMNYDQFSLRLVRGQDLNVQMQDISLVTPEVRLLGSGQVTYVTGQPLLEQPLNISLTLAGRGKVEQVLGKLRELDGTRDELGYAKAKAPVVVGGTVARPDPSSYFGRLATSKLTDSLAPEN